MVVGVFVIQFGPLVFSYEGGIPCRAWLKVIDY